VEDLMTRNLGTADRLLRVLGAVSMLGCSVFAPLPLYVRIGLLALPALYLLETSATGLCLGYWVLGRSTCPVPKGGT